MASVAFAEHKKTEAVTAHVPWMTTVEAQIEDGEAVNPHAMDLRHGASLQPAE